jgi:hypothetical protein
MDAKPPIDAVRTPNGLHTVAASRAVAAIGAPFERVEPGRSCDGDKRAAAGTDFPKHELTAQLNISQPSISQWERGKVG